MHSLPPTKFSPSAAYNRGMQTHNGVMWPAAQYAGLLKFYFYVPLYFLSPTISAAAAGIADIFHGAYNYIFGPPEPTYDQGPPAGVELGRPRTINPFAHEPPPFGHMPPGYAAGQPSANWGSPPPPQGYGQPNTMPYGSENQGVILTHLK
jgi:hypothetical protein